MIACSVTFGDATMSARVADGESEASPLDDGPTAEIPEAFIPLLLPVPDDIRKNHS